MFPGYHILPPIFCSECFLTLRSHYVVIHITLILLALFKLVQRKSPKLTSKILMLSLTRVVAVVMMTTRQDYYLLMRHKQCLITNYPV